MIYCKHFRHLWTPAQISTEAWFDAGDSGTITESAGAVSQWDDKSGNGYHMTQGTGADQPLTGTRSLGGLNVIDFSSTDYMGSSFTVPSSGDIAIFSLMEIDAVATLNASVFSMDSTSNDFQFRANNNTQFNGEIAVSDIGSNVSLSGGPFSGVQIVNANFDYTSGYYNAFMNSVQRAVNTSYTAKLNTTQDFKLMTNRAATALMDGAVAEVIAVESCTTVCRQTIEGYLAWKWGKVSNLPSNHPYKSSPPYA